MEMVGHLDSRSNQVWQEARVSPEREPLLILNYDQNNKKYTLG